MLKSTGSAGKSFWIWVLGNLLGFGGLGVALLLLPFLMTIRGLLAGTLILSLPLSLAQWLALRRISGVSILWILTIPVGLLAGLFILQNLPEGLWQGLDDESISVLTASYLFIGLLVGILQWLVLRHRFSGSSIWLLGSTIAVGGSFWLLLVTDLINRSGPFAVVAGVLVYVLGTGFMLWFMVLRSNPPPAYGMDAG